MAEVKTTKNNASVKAFIDAIEDGGRRADARAVMKLMGKITGKRPAMWGTSIVGYGSYHFRYASGREGDWFLTGFSPRKQALTMYIMGGFTKHAALLKELGRHKTGKGCLYVRRLEDIDVDVLAELIEASVAHVKKTSV